MSFEGKVLQFNRLADDIIRTKPVIEGKTFKGEVVHIDFADYHKCKFEKCTIILEFGLSSMRYCTFNNCKFEVKTGSPASFVLQLDKMLRESAERERTKKQNIHSNMNSNVPLGKYSKWCHRRPLACDDEGKYRKASEYLRRGELTSIERNVMFIHDLVGCQGIEFVVFSSAKFVKRVTLPGNITLIPCFLPEIGGKSWNDPLVRLSELMMSRARFIYDGWMPITDWNIDNVRESIRKIERTLSLFSIRERISTTWEPKYMMHQVNPTSHNIEDEHIEEIKKLPDIINSWKPDDSWAFYRSLGWLSQSLTLPLSASRFLLCIVAIESLATYIENKATDDSIFAIFKATTKTDKEESDKCIEEILERLYEKDKIKAIESSFYDCIYLSIKKMLESHLNKVFKVDKKPLKLLFTDKIEEKTLYNIRHTIAHGGLDALSDLQRQMIKD